MQLSPDEQGESLDCLSDYKPDAASLEDFIECEVRMNLDHVVGGNGQKEVLWELVKPRLLSAKEKGAIAMPNGNHRLDDMRTAFTRVYDRVRQEHLSYTAEPQNGKVKLAVGVTCEGVIMDYGAGRFIRVHTDGGPVHVPWQDHGNVKVERGKSVRVRVTRNPMDDHPSHGGVLLEDR